MVLPDATSLDAMCTVTIVPRRHGFRLVSNRDELETRPVATTPELHSIPPGVATFPTDPASGGTWIGVNDRGLAMSILNRTDRADAGRFAPRSRGLIVPSLLGHDRARAAVAAAGQLDPAAYEPFYLVVTDGTEAGLVSSNGHDTSTRWFSLVEPLLFTSSGLGDALVERPRRELFERLVLQAADSWLDGQARFHRHRWPDRPELSVWMERSDARTVSRSTIEVTEKTKIDFHYEPLNRLKGD
jgi:hypothetical protein